MMCEQVLDHGLVRLVDHMGSDLSVVRSARVSYNAEWRTGEDAGKDEKLIHYLVKNRHTTPIEGVQFTFEVKAPIFVLRQWHRHRTWCIDGDSMISFELPGRYKSGRKGAKKLKLSELAKRWNVNPLVKRPTRQKRSLREFQRERISKMMLRVYDENARKFTVGHIVDITNSGQKIVYEVTLKNGKSLNCTKDHQLLTPMGWKRLEECSIGEDLLCNGATYTTEGLENIRRARSGERSNFWKGGITSERANIARWTTEQAKKVHEKFNYICQQCNKRGGKLHAHHIKPVVTHPELSKDFNNLLTLCFTCHSKEHGKTGEICRGRGQFLTAIPSRIVSIKKIGIKDTYDISVGGSNHNFVANGIIVHNCYNEVSARYSELPEEFYIPKPQDVGVQSKSNKQMREIATEAGITEADELFIHDLQVHSRMGFEYYRKHIEAGVPRELARLFLGLNTYSHMFATVDLHNLFHFLRLRLHSHAQMEIRVYAEAMLNLIRPIVPITVAAWEEHIYNK